MMSSLMVQVLRKPKEFLIALMEKFGQLSQSADPDVSGHGVYVSFIICSIPIPGYDTRDCDYSLCVSVHCTTISC